MQMVSMCRKFRSIHLSIISKAHSRALDNDLLPIVRTVCKLVAGPSFRRRVTGPAAPVQVRVTGTLAVMLESSAAVFVN